MASTTARTALTLLGAVALVALVAFGAGRLLASDEPPSAGPLDVDFLGFAQPVRPGGAFYVNTGEAVNTGDDPVEILGVRLPGATAGLELRGLRRNPPTSRGLRFDLAGGRTLVADARGAGFPGEFPPAVGARLDAGEGTWLVLLLRAPERRGPITIPEVEIRYRAGDDEWLTRVPVGHTVCVGATGPC